MKHLKLNGRLMPALGLGTWQLQGVTCRHAIREALDVGYRHFDTARMYENEGDVGGALRESEVNREDVFLTTKIWHDDLSPEALRRECDASLTLLDTDYLDLLLVHWPNPEIPIEKTLDGMHDLVDEGRVRHLGVSNFTPDLLEKAARHARISCNQVEYHPLLDQSALLEATRRNGIVLTAYSPLAQGKALREEAVREIAERLGRTAAQVVLRWLLQHENVAAIPRSSDPDHIESNFRVFDFELTEEDVDRISGLARGARQIDPEWAPAWREG